MFSQITLTLLILLQIARGGIVGVYNELSDQLQNDLKTLVQNGKYTVFSSVLQDYGLDSTEDVVLALWDYICALDGSDVCAAIGSADLLQGMPAFAQLEMYGGDTFSGYWDTVPFTSIKFNKLINMDSSTRAVSFQIKGIYKFTIGYRGGTGNDVWSAIRIWGMTSGTVGISEGAGKIGGGDPTQHSFSFFFEINDLSDGYLVQIGRYDGTALTLVDTASWNDGSESPPTITALIEFVGNV